MVPPTGYVYVALDIEAIGSHVVAILTPTTPAFFGDEVALSNGVYYLQLPNGNPFGYYAFLEDPRLLYHFDLGYEYVFDAADGHGGVYLYDFKSSTFFYTSQTFPFPTCTTSAWIRSYTTIPARVRQVATTPTECVIFTISPPAGPSSSST